MYYSKKSLHRIDTQNLADLDVLTFISTSSIQLKMETGNLSKDHRAKISPRSQMVLKHNEKITKQDWGSAGP